MYNVFFHETPPSVVLKIPLSEFLEYKWPKEATIISSGLFGLIFTFPI